MSTEKPPLHHTVLEVAKVLGTSKSTVTRYIRSGRVKAWRVEGLAAGAKWRIPHAEFLRLVVLSQPAPLDATRPHRGSDRA